MKTLTLTLLTLTTLALAEVIPISTLDDLAKIGRDPAFPLDGDYKLMNDIDASPSRAMDNGKGWEPIGRWTTIDEPGIMFTGSFDGNFKTISGLYCNRPDMAVVALFAAVAGTREDSAVIKNLHLDIDTMIGGSFAGAMFGGVDFYAIITNCYVTGGLIYGEYNKTGGMFFGFADSRITNCYIATQPPSKFSAAGCAPLCGGAKSNYYLSEDPRISTEYSGLTAQDMKRRASFAGWDFDNIWQIDEGESFPYFRKDAVSIRYNVRNNSRAVNAASLRGRVLTVVGNARVVDVRGKTVARFGAGQHVVKIPRGAYMVEVMRDERREAAKVIVK